MTLGCGGQVIARFIASVPAPAGALRDEVEQRKQRLVGELHRAGAILQEHLAAQGMTEIQLDADLLEATACRACARAVIDEPADAEKLEVTEDELHDEVTARARSADVSARSSPTCWSARAHCRRSSPTCAARRH